MTDHLTHASGGPGMAEHVESMDGVQDGLDMAWEQKMAQEQLQRSMEASKQMLYGVYGNVITMLEEFEQRELKATQNQIQTDRSNIKLPDQSHKNDFDIKSILDAQLVVFNSQLKACPPEAKKELETDLKKKLILWNAQRNEKNIPIGITDTYAAQVFALIAVGDSSGLVNFAERKTTVKEGDMREAFQAYIHGDHERQQLDQDFKDDPDKKAVSPEVRSGGSIRQGVDRLLTVRQDLKSHVEEFLNEDLT